MFRYENAESTGSRAKERAEEAMRLTQLLEFRNRKPAKLSGGQQQRVAIARAIVNNPRVLLLDEPLGALDFKLRKDLQRELKNLQRNLGITFIYVTHDQEEAMSMSDRIVVMNKSILNKLERRKKFIISRKRCSLRHLSVKIIL